MRISKMINIEDGIKLNYFEKKRIVSKNICTQNLYLICTSPCNHWLFEIISSQDLSSRYIDSYLVGVTKTRRGAILQVKCLVNQIYNTRDIKYDELVL